MKRLGIYVQVPFCQTKCTYCNFHTGVVAKERFRPYVAAVCREIREHRELVRAAGVTWGTGPLQESRKVNECSHGGTARGEGAASRSSGQASGGKKAAPPTAIIMSWLTGAERTRRCFKR